MSKCGGRRSIGGAESVRITPTIHSETAANTASAIDVPVGSQLVASSMPGTVVSVDVAVGDPVCVGQTLLIIEAMKMQHVISADVGGNVRRVLVNSGETIHDGHSMLVIEVSETATDQPAAVQVQAFAIQ